MYSPGLSSVPLSLSDARLDTEPFVIPVCVSKDVGGTIITFGSIVGKGADVDVLETTAVNVGSDVAVATLVAVFVGSTVEVKVG